jgi:hypothetical protein
VTTKGRRLLPVLLTALVLLTGCSGGSTGSSDVGDPTAVSTSAATVSSAGGGLAALASAVASAATAAPATGSPTASAAASGTAASGGAPSPTVAAASQRVGAAGDYLQFSTPSKNIGCYITHFDVRCDIADKIWTLAKPAGCELDFGNGLSLTISGPGEVVCAGDTVLGGTTTVAYDHGVVAGEFQCLVTKAGVMCRNTGTGHGFTLSREAHAEF